MDVFPVDRSSCCSLTLFHFPISKLPWTIELLNVLRVLRCWCFQIVMALCCCCFDLKPFTSCTILSRSSGSATDSWTTQSVTRSWFFITSNDEITATLSTTWYNLEPHALAYDFGGDHFRFPFSIFSLCVQTGIILLQHHTAVQIPPPFVCAP